MAKLEPVVDRMFKKGMITVDDVDLVNSALILSRINVYQFETVVFDAVMNALSEKENTNPLLMVVMAIRWQEAVDQDASKGDILKSAEKVCEEINKPISISAVLDPEVLSLVATFALPEKALQKICTSVRVNSMFTDPDYANLEIKGMYDNEMKLFTDWERYVENLKCNKALVLLGRITIAIDTDLARNRILQLIASGIQVAVPLKLPHLFKKDNWKQLKEAMEKSSIPEGEPVLYLENMVIKKPFDLAKIKQKWERIYKGCNACPHNQECAPEAIF